MKPQIKSTLNRITQSFRRKLSLQIIAGLLIAMTLGVGVVFPPSSNPLSGSAAAQGEKISQSAIRQIEALMEEKESRTPEQMKIDSQLLYRLKQKRGVRIAPGVERLGAGVKEAADGSVLLDIRAKVTPEVLEAIRKAGEVVYAYEQFGAIRARLPIDALEAIAGLDDVKFIRPADEAMINSEVRRSADAGTAGKSALTPRPTRAERAARVREQLRRALPLIMRTKESNRQARLQLRKPLSLSGVHRIPQF